MLLGGPSSQRSQPAWRQAYRALDHGTARKQCEHPDIRKFPNAIQDFADLLGAMQRKRHYADYDPAKTYNAKPIRKSEVVQDILDAENAINRLQAVPAKDRRAFAILVLLNIRRTR